MDFNDLFKAVDKHNHQQDNQEFSQPAPPSSPFYDYVKKAGFEDYLAYDSLVNKLNDSWTQQSTKLSSLMDPEFSRLLDETVGSDDIADIVHSAGNPDVRKHFEARRASYEATRAIQAEDLTDADVLAARPAAFRANRLGDLASVYSGFSPYYDDFVKEVQQWPAGVAAIRKYSTPGMQALFESKVAAAGVNAIPDAVEQMQSATAPESAAIRSEPPHDGNRSSAEDQVAAHDNPANANDGALAADVHLPAEALGAGPEAFWREGGVPPYDTLMIGWARKQPEWDAIDGEAIDVDYTTVDPNEYHRVFDDLSQLGEADHELAAAMREDLDHAATAEGQRHFDQKAAMYASALNAGAPGPAPAGMGGGGFSLGGWGRPRPPAPPRHAPSALTQMGRAFTDKLHAYRKSRTVDAFQQVDDAGETVQKSLDRLRNSAVGPLFDDGQLGTDQGRKRFMEAMAKEPEAKALYERLSDDVRQFGDHIQKAGLAATRAGYDPDKVQDLLKRAAGPIVNQVKDIPDAKDPKGDKTLGDSVKAAIKAIKVILAALTRRNPSPGQDHDYDDDGPRLSA